MEATDRLHSAHDRRVAPFLRFFEGSLKIFDSMTKGRPDGRVSRRRRAKRRRGSMRFRRKLSVSTGALEISISVNEIISFLG